MFLDCLLAVNARRAPHVFHHPMTSGRAWATNTPRTLESSRIPHVHCQLPISPTTTPAYTATAHYTPQLHIMSGLENALFNLKVGFDMSPLIINTLTPSSSPPSR